MRKEKALKLAEATLEMIALAPPAGARQAGFTLARSVIAHSLDYDAGVLPCSALLPHASVIDQAVLSITAATMGVSPHELTEDVRLQMRLPTRYAGLQLDSVDHIVPLARVAKLIGDACLVAQRCAVESVSTGRAKCSVVSGAGASFVLSTLHRA